MELRVTPCGKGRSWRLWPTTESVPAGAVAESSTHVLELDGLAFPDTAVLCIDGMPLKALRNPSSTAARWEWEVGFHAGSVEVEISDGHGRTHRAEIVIDPDHRKLTRLAFETMVFEAFEDMHAVCAMSPVRIGVDRGTRRPGLAKVEFFRSRFASLIASVRRISVSPHRHLEPVEKIIPIQRATRITPADLQRSLRYQPSLKVTNPRLPKSIRDALPARVAIRQRRSSVDNPENRAVKTCLERWCSWLNRAAKAFEVSPRKDEDGGDVGMRQVWARRCRTMSRQLGAELDTSFFAEIGEGDERIADGSSIFRVVPGYQQFSRIRRDLGYGLAAVAGDWLDMPLAQTWRIYELWVFWKLARAAAMLAGTGAVSIQGAEKERDGTINIAMRDEWSMALDAGRGLRVLFQRRFKEYWVDSAHTGSFSREMIPDVAITVGPPDDCGLVVVDAKYRVHNALADALTSIHTYRDALVQENGVGAPTPVVKGSYLVTPHVPGAPATNWTAESMPNRLFHPAYRGAFRFGAATMVPGRTSPEQARDLLRQILNDSGIALPPA